MHTISASDAHQDFAGVLETVEHEPVMIRHQKQDIAIVMSIREYERLTHLNVAEFQYFCDRLGAMAQNRGMTEEKLTELLPDAH